MALFQIVVGTYEKVLFGWVVKERPTPVPQTKTKTKTKKANSEEDDALVDALRDDTSPLVLERSFSEMPHTGCIKTVHTTGRFLISGSTDEAIKVYDLRKMREIGTLLQHESGITAARLVESTHMLSGDEDGKICVWRCKDWEVVKVLKGHQLGINSISIHPSGKLALTVSRDRTMHLWNLLNGRSAFKSQLKYEAEIVEWSPNGDSYALVSHHSVRLFSSKGELVDTIEGNEYKHILSLVYLSEDTIAYGGEDMKITIYNHKEKKVVTELTGFENRIKSLAVAPKVGKPKDKYPYLISISSDYRLCVWDLDHSTSMPAAETIVNARPVCLTASLMPDPLNSDKPGAVENSESNSDNDEVDIERDVKIKAKKQNEKSAGGKRKFEESDKEEQLPKKKFKGETDARKPSNGSPNVVPKAKTKSAEADDSDMDLDSSELDEDNDSSNDDMEMSGDSSDNEDSVAENEDKSPASQKPVSKQPSLPQQLKNVKSSKPQIKSKKPPPSSKQLPKGILKKK